MPTQNVNLPPHQSKFIRDRVRSGKYQNASEVVRAGLRLLEQQEAEDGARLEALRRLTREAFDELDRGEYRAMDEVSLSEWLSPARRGRTKNSGASQKLPAKRTARKAG